MYVYFIVDIDECTSFPCQNDGTCTDLFNGYECNCTIGWKGTHCETGLTSNAFTFSIYN